MADESLNAPPLKGLRVVEFAGLAPVYVLPLLESSAPIH